MISSLAFFTLCAMAVFGLTLPMNVVRKNTTLIALYVMQSFAVVGAFVALASGKGEFALLAAAFLILAVKAIIAPFFLFQMIKKYNAHFSASSYLNAPLALLSLAVITVLSYGWIAPGLSAISTTPSSPLLFASIFTTLFLMINRRGALSAVVGILSLENCIVLLAAHLGHGHSIALELAIAFDITVWIAVAAAFLTMMHRQFGDIETAPMGMTHLKD